MFLEAKTKKADALSKIASTSFAHLSKQVLVEELKEKSISAMEVLAVVEEEGDTWMTPVFKYLMDGTLPVEVKKARAVKRKSWRFSIINRTLYKKSFLGPWLRCVGPLQANYVLREIHEGSCSMHAAKAKALITSPWPFYKWGIDIAGPFPEGPGKFKFLIVAIDYFTKWIEILDSQREIISDNGKQFQDNPFKDWCEQIIVSDKHFAFMLSILKLMFVERANHSLGEGIKARFDERSKKWMEELPHVLWAHRTMIKSSNVDTPFSLTYGTEAVIPAEIGMSTLRIAEVDLVQNDESLVLTLTY
ncbi:reverse transcriptase domain-containing protein [Tanacetum coccineum]